MAIHPEREREEKSDFVWLFSKNSNDLSDLIERFSASFPIVIVPVACAVRQ